MQKKQDASQSIISKIVDDKVISRASFPQSLNKTETTSSNDKQQKTPRLLTYAELEPWQQDNPYIQNFYRAATTSYAASFHSLLYIHNQTVNIYTHLLGFIAFFIAVFGVFYVLASCYEQADATDFFVFAMFFAGSEICLSLSAAFHTFGNHSDVLRHHFLMMDMAGIVSLIVGSFYPGVYYGFYCEPEIVKIYWTMVSMSPSHTAFGSMYAKKSNMHLHYTCVL